MFKRINAINLSDLFLPIDKRSGEKGVYFIRLCLWSQEIKQFTWTYHEAARKKGVIIERQINNPDEGQLRFMNEILGTSFEPTTQFMESALQKWMPRMSAENRTAFTNAICMQFEELKKEGKADSIIRNIYSKMMCWLYYRFERLMPYLGENDPPKILYECNSMTAHELKFLRIMSMMGSDIVLLETQSDDSYLKHDAESCFAQLMNVQGTAFPKDFSLKQFRKEMSNLSIKTPVQQEQVNSHIQSDPIASFVHQEMMKRDKHNAAGQTQSVQQQKIG